MRNFRMMAEVPFKKRCKFYIEIRQEKFTWFFLQQITCFKIFELYSITLHLYPDKRDHYFNLQSYNLIEILIPKVEKKLNMEIFISLIFCSSLWSSLENLQPFPESSVFFFGRYNSIRVITYNFWTESDYTHDGA